MTLLTTLQPQQQLSTIEKSVTHLLVATKQLLETLTMWSRGSASEGEVSDVYVRLGYEFNIACRAFGAIGVETSDLGPVPDMLRAILEDTLSQEASQASLDKFLPRIRDIIINLLHGLKKKQQRLRQKGSGSSKGLGSDGAPPRQASIQGNASAESQLSQQLDDIPARQSSRTSYAPQRQGSGDATLPDLPPRTTSVPGRHSPRRTGLSPQSSLSQSGSRETMGSDSGSSMSSYTTQNMPVVTPYPEVDTTPTGPPYEQDSHPPIPPDPPKPLPKQNDALSALQKTGDLERRASRRFSSYQISKHLGTNGITTMPMPPAQHSPLPNRGRDVRESLSAVRSRGSAMHQRNRSRNQGKSGAEPSPSRVHEVRKISEEPSERTDSVTQPPTVPFAHADELGSPMIKTPEDKLAAYPFPTEAGSPEKASATVSGPVQEQYAPAVVAPTPERVKAETPVRSASRKLAETYRSTPPPLQYVAEGSPQPGKELTLFLQYKSKIKKFVLPDGGDLSIARLQLAFIERFAWNTQNNGADLPEIYIQDPISGVRHELEDLTDIKERSVLVLNVEVLDEVKRHFDDGIGGLRRIVEGIKSSVDDQQTSLQRVSDRQQETAKEMASIAAAPPPAPPSRTLSKSSSINPSRTDKSSQISELAKLRQDLAVVRQTYTSFVSDMDASMTVLRTKAASVKRVAADTTTPALDSNEGRAYIDKGKASLSSDSERIVNRVDDMQDLVEDLRKDVVSRGVRPIPRQLESVSKDISVATADLKKLQEFLKKEKPIWTKIWERELQVVCEERDLLTLQEELAIDLEDDLEKAAATFALVEQATKQQNLHKPVSNDAAPTGGTPRVSSRNLKPLPIATTADPHKAKDNVLGEVRALQPNHESRLEAIERAERSRRKELEERKGGEFQRELGTFVEESKLKKTGGVEEVERLRKVREEKARREVQERARLKRLGLDSAGAPTAEKEAEKPNEVVVVEDRVKDVETNGVQTNGLDSGRETENSSPEPGFEDAKEEVVETSTGSTN